MGVIPWGPLNGGWLAGRYRRGEAPPPDSRAARMGGRFDPSRPENARKHDIVEELAKLAAEAGCSPVQLALAFVLVHPAVTSVIIGPRTMAHLESQLGAPDVALSDDVLDRIDALVPPGTNVAPGDAGYTPPAVESAWRRRRARRD
jgi:aryl-alcohol dehydrogenase-like predicted oxidoreductase